MDESSKALPSEWVQRLFARFRTIYGNRADVAYGVADADELVAEWAATLGAFVGDDLRNAIDAMKLAFPEYPPTLPQFTRLCLDAKLRRMEFTRRLDAPRELPPPGFFDSLRQQLNNDSGNDHATWPQSHDPPPH